MDLHTSIRGCFSLHVEERHQEKNNVLAGRGVSDTCGLVITRRDHRSKLRYTVSSYNSSLT